MEVCGFGFLSKPEPDLFIAVFFVDGRSFKAQLVYDLFVQEQANETHRGFGLRKKGVRIDVLLDMLAQVSQR